MKKILLLLLLSLGLIGNSWSEERAPSDEQLLDIFNNQIADILTVREESMIIYWMEVNELIEKRKLLNPESNQEEIDEIIKLATDAHKKCFDTVNILFDRGFGLAARINKIRYELYISESRISYDTTIYYRMSKNQFIQLHCPDWNILYSKSLEEITDSDS